MSTLASIINSLSFKNIQPLGASALVLLTQCFWADSFSRWCDRNGPLSWSFVDLGGEHSDQFASEPLTCYAIEAEIDGVIKVDEFVVDDFCDVINRALRSSRFPVRLANHKHNARSNADETSE